MGYISYGDVLLFALSFSKEWDINLIVTSFCLLYCFQRMGYRSYCDVLLFVVSFQKNGV